MSKSVWIGLVPEHPEKLVIPEGKPAEKLHITLAFTSSDVHSMGWDPREALHAIARAVARRVRPFSAKSSGVALMGPPEHRVTTLLLSSLCFEQAKVWAKAQDFANSYPHFVPHLTIADGHRVATVAALAAREPTVDITAVRVVIGDEVTDYSLEGQWL